MLGRWTLRRLQRNYPVVAFGRTPKQKLYYHVGAPLYNVQNIRKNIKTTHYPHLRPEGYPQNARLLFTSSIPSILVPPLIFVGLLLTLWTWKCFWIVVLQDKLLYLSWLPPLTRSDTIDTYESECRPVQWQEKRIRSLDGTKLTVCEGLVNPPRDKDAVVARNGRKKSVVICYFQGNGGSTPMRLPLLSQVLRAISNVSTRANDDNVEYTIVALSYRGYWTSSGRATQSGIERDAQAFLNWVIERYSAPETDLQLVLWGHSLGAAVASDATLKYLSHNSTGSVTGRKPASEDLSVAPPPIAGLILEAPISSIKDMLISLYPQKWLPYRYLWPLSWNNWSVSSSLERMAHLRDERRCSTSDAFSDENQRGTSYQLPPILLLSAEKDEVIPPWVADQLEHRGKSLALDIERKDVSGAMHIEIPVKADGRKTMVDFILKSISR